MIRWLVGRMAHHAPSSDVEKGTAMCVITVTSRGPHRSADHMLDPRAEWQKRDGPLLVPDALPRRTPARRKQRLQARMTQKKMPKRTGGG